MVRHCILTKNSSRAPAMGCFFHKKPAEYGKEVELQVPVVYASMSLETSIILKPCQNFHLQL